MCLVSLSLSFSATFRNCRAIQVIERFVLDFRGPRSLLFSGCRDSFLRDETTAGVKITTHSHLVSNVSISGAVPPGLQYVNIKHRDNFTLVFSNIVQLYFCHSGSVHVYSVIKKILLSSVQ